MLARAAARLVRERAREECRAHHVVTLVRAGVEVLCGLAYLSSQPHAPRQLLSTGACDCVFGRLSGERAAARKEIFLPRLDRGDHAVIDNYYVGGTPLRVLNVRLRRAEDERLGHVGFRTRPGWFLYASRAAARRGVSLPGMLTVERLRAGGARRGRRGLGCGGGGTVWQRGRRGRRGR